MRRMLASRNPEVPFTASQTASIASLHTHTRWRKSALVSKVNKH